MYVRALTAEQINNAVTPETVNEHVDLSGTFDPERSQIIWTGSTVKMNVTSLDLSGLIRIRINTKAGIEIANIVVSMAPAVGFQGSNQFNSPAMWGVGDNNLYVRVYREGSGDLTMDLHARNEQTDYVIAQLERVG